MENASDELDYENENRVKALAVRKQPGGKIRTG
jgi:hypothetical protein